MQRNETVDLVKGFLIVLVILGHVIQGAMQESLARSFIYIFHMPLFFFVSGYLIDYRKLNQTTVKTFLSKYTLNVLIPWAIAVTAYYLVIMKSHTIDGYARAFLHPFYHLWFILAFLAYVLYAYIFSKIFNGKYAFALLLTSTAISLTALTIGGSLNQNIIAEHIYYDLRLTNLMYFAIGIALRYYAPKIPSSALSITLPSIAIIPYIFYGGTLFSDRALGALVNTALCIATYAIITNFRDRKIPALNYIGKNSMYFYLYHVFAIYVSAKLTKQENSFDFFFLCIVLTTPIYALIFTKDTLKALSKKALFIILPKQKRTQSTE